jgi:DNA-binding NarL/FixJ family response regulator
MFQPRIAAAATSLGLDVRIADAPETLSDAIAARPAMVVVDLHAAGIDAITAITDAKATGAAVLAFGRHTEPATLRAARNAGADTVVPRSQLVAELAVLLAALLGAAGSPA